MGARSKQRQPAPLQQAGEITPFLCFKSCYLQSKLSGASSDKIWLLVTTSLPNLNWLDSISQDTHLS